jgi:AraC-like DNA-binding protein
MQGPLFQRIHLHEDKSFNVLKVQRPYFVVPWHFHPEIEIMLVLKGKGTRFVGDCIESFEPYDLVMVGPNLAHVWKNSSEHFADDPNIIAEARVILFKENCFGENFFSLPEMKIVHDLIERSSRGIKFSGEGKDKVIQNMVDACEKPVVQQFTMLINILETLALTKDFSYLCSAGYDQKIQASDLVRLNTVVDYLMKNFREPIKLEVVAEISNMTSTAFCRYFKSRTNKTVIQFINELRIGYAHKLLAETNYNVEQICFESGFHNVSNFYEQFKKITGKSPFKFRKDVSSFKFQVSD